MSAILLTILGSFNKLIGVGEPVGGVSSLKNGVTLEEVLGGLKAASGLNWAEIEKAVDAHFVNIPDDLTTIEDLAKAVSPFLPDAIYVSDVASVLLLLIKMGDALPPNMRLVTTEHGPVKPIFGEATASENHAPFI
jgi:hypothetical protein